MEIETTKRFCNICDAEAEMPADTLRGLELAPGLIAAAVRAGGAAPRDGWSPAEVAVHLADTEIVKGWRLRQILVKDEPAIDPYDQEAWAAALWYPERDPGLALDTFAVMRRANLELLRALPESGWERSYVQPEYGRRTLRDLVRHISDHDLAHLRQIRAL
ncbi:MAG: DinB family protein [Dehalococcoidia bacterium]|nr:DinB family protein [Dehalococcoidia bacterium]